MNRASGTMKRATQQLPENYLPQGEIDLERNRTAAVVLNIVGTILLIVFAFIFLALARTLRPDLPPVAFSASGLEIFFYIGGALLLVGLMVILHELIHGVFFWMFTGARPVFGYKGLYAYAGAPDWYLPRNQYALVGLAPLAVITTAGLLLLTVAPVGWLYGILLVIVANAAGAVGDMLVVAWLFTRPAATLVRDTGDAVTLFHPEAA